jgi:uncharacterized membrane protein YphA (DoxX/SURF4 family)
MESKKWKKWFETLLRLVIGLTFIFASIHKIADPAQFAKIIYGYGLFPHAFINLIAITLPFIELITGGLIVCGKYKNAAAILAFAMMAAFIVIISINMIRGHDFDCGCFSFQTEGSMFGKNFLLVRDIVLLIICIVLIRAGKDCKGEGVLECHRRKKS